MICLQKHTLKLFTESNRLLFFPASCSFSKYELQEESRNLEEEPAAAGKAWHFTERAQESKEQEGNSVDTDCIMRGKEKKK